MFAPHPSAALEYWYFKVNAGPIALIVDWIERRKLNEHVMRVSIHSPQKREVLFEDLAALMPGDNFLSTQRTAGHAGDVAWELDIDPGHNWLKPYFPATIMQMTDTTLISAPQARFSGWIRHGTEQTSLDHVPGLLSQYWGRSLSPEWWWISTHQFDQDGVVVDCVVGCSRLWGIRMELPPLGYLYLQQGGRREFFVLGPHSPVRIAGSPEKFQIEFSRIGREKITLVGTGREYGDFGEGIVNTLTGDLEIREGNRSIARANGTAGLEHRFPSQTANLH